MRCCGHIFGEALAHVSDSNALRACAEEFLAAHYPDVKAGVAASCSILDAAGLVMADAKFSGQPSLVFVKVVLADLCCSETQRPLGAVAYGDSAFLAPAAPPLFPGHAVGVSLTKALPVFAFWPSAAEVKAGEEVRAGLDSVMGVGAPAIRHVALGHRPELVFPLEKRDPFPDPLELGEAMGQEFKSPFLIEVSTTEISVHLRARPVAGFAQGTARAFRSGKLTLKSVRLGHVLLKVLVGDRGIPSVEAEDGMVWVLVMPIDADVTSLPFMAAAVNPTLVMEWSRLATLPEYSGNCPSMAVAEDCSRLDTRRGSGALSLLVTGAPALAVQWKATRDGSQEVAH